MAEHSPPPPAARLGERLRSLPLALACAAVLVIGVLVDVDASRATLAGWEGPVCLLNAAFGSGYCPGCGLTRSAALALQGQVGASLAMHPIGFLVPALAAFGLVVHGAALWRGGPSAGVERALRAGWGLFFAAALAATAAGWVGRGLHTFSP